ncbi:MAG TPA: cupin domain-containing protein [Thermoleophilaceae bacterium]|nr:cupin domain-containing protein [Thermoleophilaceae bacterium]
MPTAIAVSDLPGNLIGRFEGGEYGSSVSFFIGTFDAGTGPGLHRHPYDETFIVEAGSATFTVGDETLELEAGQIAVVPAGTPHKFVSGEGFRLISITPAERMEQEDLE